MSDEYQLRKDIDELIVTVFDVDDKQLRLVPFDDRSSLQGIASKQDNSDMGTLDAIMKYYRLLDVAERTDNQENQLSNILNLVYPIGSIYMSVNSTDPSILFGGSWLRLKDTFLLASGDTYAPDPITQTVDDETVDVDTALHGEANHTLTTDEMPSHSHRVSSGWQSATGTDRITFGQVSGQYQQSGVGSTQFIENTGGGQAHNNMPPYLSVYMWRRIE